MTNQICNIWYLGIDFGTTGISAIILNASTDEQYPIYWTTFNNTGETESSFRLPSLAYSGLVDGSDLPNSQSGIFIEKFKAYLNIAIPYYSSKNSNWEPVLQWSSQQSVSLYWVQQALQELLTTLIPSNNLKNNLLKVSAVDLTDQELIAIISNLSGVILGNPVNFGDTYRFNLREAVLGAHLVNRPEQIFFVEDAIAAILSRMDELHHPDWTTLLSEESINLDNSALSNPTERNFQPSSFRGGILAIDAGSSSTEIALVDVPENLKKLTHSDFLIHSFPYGGQAIDQDIICQMLLKGEGRKMSDFGLSLLNLKDKNFEEEIENPQFNEFNNHHQSVIPDLKSFEMPLPGEPDVQNRYQLQQLLQSSPLGQALLQAAGYLKLILQHQQEFTLDLGEQKWVCTRAEFQHQVILPFIQRLNREVNILLSKTGMGVQGIRQVIFTGGTSALKEMEEWLHQKFLNSTLVKDNYKDGGLKTCSRIAHGLASLPLYPQVLERQKQQYSDYFLFLELLHIFPERDVSISEIMQLLERRGINTRACKPRLLTFLAGELPSGLMPAISDAICLSLSSQQNVDYQTITAAPLFYPQENQIYRPNREQYMRLRRYLSILLSGTYQKLEEPLIADLGI